MTSPEKMQPARGTQDFLSTEMLKYRYIESLAHKLSIQFGFEEISTPIFEFSPVFHRTLGETSDVVAKETYTFTDRGGESLTLRPEGTAGIARSFISNGLSQHLPLKFYYSGPMFRYERPQKGRFRQFHQIGVEALGYDTPQSDAEVISLGSLLLTQLGLIDKVTLEINTLGDSASRFAHKEKLVNYLSRYKSELSADSQVRLEKNPLRILDSKDANDQKLLQGAPLLKNELNTESQLFFDQVQESLNSLGLNFKVNEQLVRGLDYYNHTVFEYTTTHLGAQSAVLAGGRYDGLIELMGGPKVRGVGWASGVERLMLMLDPELMPKTTGPIALIPMTEELEKEAAVIAFKLRSQGASVQVVLGGNAGKRFKKADKLGASFAYILGSDEWSRGEIAIKDLKTGEQVLKKISSLISV